MNTYNLYHIDSYLAPLSSAPFGPICLALLLGHWLALAGGWVGPLEGFLVHWEVLWVLVTDSDATDDEDFWCLFVWSDVFKT
jgi:hypothetical protein